MGTKERNAMRAQMITGFFQYEPCELSARDDALTLRMAGSERVVAAAELTDASLSRGKNGSCRLELATRNERFEFLLPDARAGKEATGLLYELTKNNERLELCMRGE